MNVPPRYSRPVASLSGTKSPEVIERLNQRARQSTRIANGEGYEANTFDANEGLGVLSREEVGIIWSYRETIACGDEELEKDIQTARAAAREDY